MDTYGFHLFKNNSRMDFHTFHTWSVIPVYIPLCIARAPAPKACRIIVISMSTPKPGYFFVRGKGV